MTARHFPDLLPQIPSATPRIENLALENPFALDDGVYVHPALQGTRSPVIAAEKVISINAFIKARITMHMPSDKKEVSKIPLRYIQGLRQPEDQAGAGPESPSQASDLPNTVSQLPPSFGDVA